jgi:hypothetical protein
MPPDSPGPPRDPGAPPIVGPPPGAVPPAFSPPAWPPAAPEPHASPWLSIWVAPRATLRRILVTDPRRRVLAIAMLAGVARGLGIAASAPAAGALPATGHLALALLAGPPAGVAWLYLLGWLVRVTGRLLGGRGGTVAVRAALAWSAVPLVWTLLLWLPRAALLGAETFHPSPAGIEGHVPSEAIFGLLMFLQLTVDVWTIVVGAKCLGEAHGFSAWRGFFAYLLALLILVFPIIVVAGAAIILGLTGA